MFTVHLGTKYRMFVFLQTFSILQKILVWDFNEFLEWKPHVLYEWKLCLVRLWVYHARRKEWKPELASLGCSWHVSSNSQPELQDPEARTQRHLETLCRNVLHCTFKQNTVPIWEGRERLMCMQTLEERKLSLTGSRTWATAVKAPNPSH